MSPAGDAILRPGPRRRLTEDEILDAALEILAHGGLEALSIRSVVSRLKASPGTFYTYYENKEALLEAVMARSFQVVGRSDLTGEWRADLRTIVGEIHEAFDSHPATITLLTAGVGSHRLDPAHERLLLLLDQAGLTLDQCISLQDALVSLAVGHVIVDQGHGRAAGRVEELARRRALDTTTYPHLAEAARRDPTTDRKATFSLALEALLDTVEALGSDAR